MGTLFTQIYTVILLVLSTWAMCHDLPFGSLDGQRAAVDGTTSQIKITHFTSRLLVEQECPAERSLEGEKLDRRMYAYVRAEPSKAQEDALKHWSMLPFESATQWYSDYQAGESEVCARKGCPICWEGDRSLFAAVVVCERWCWTAKPVVDWLRGVDPSLCGGCRGHLMK